MTQPPSPRGPFTAPRPDRTGDTTRLGAAALLAFIEGAGEVLTPPAEGPIVAWLDAWAATDTDDPLLWAPTPGGARPDPHTFPWDALAACIRRSWARIAAGDLEVRDGPPHEPWVLAIDRRERAGGWAWEARIEAPPSSTQAPSV